MSTPLAVMFADAHVDSHTWAAIPTLCGDSAFSLRQIFDFAIKNNVPYIISAGDQFDSQKCKSYPYAIWNEQLDRLRKTNSKFLFIDGNHDWDNPPKLAFHDRAIYIDSKIFQLGPFTAYGLSYKSSAELAEALASMPSADWLICHQGWKEIQRFGATQGSITQIQKAKKVLTGDYHKNFTKIIDNGSYPLEIFSPGSIALQDISEPADKYFFVLYDDGTVQRVPLRTRIVIDVSNLQETKDVINFVNSLGEKLTQAINTAKALGYPQTVIAPIVRGYYDRSLSETIRVIYDKFSEITKEKGILCYLFLREYNSSPKACPHGVFELNTAIDGSIVLATEEFLLQRLEKSEADKDTISLAETLLHSEEPREAFKLWRKNFLKKTCGISSEEIF